MKTIDHYPLTHGDKEALAELMDCGLDTADKRGFVLRVLCELRAKESRGDQSARRIIEKTAYDGLFKYFNQRASRETGVFMHPETGRVLNVPQRGSVGVASESGAPTGSRQLKLWKEMSIPEFKTWSTAQLHLADSLRFKAAGIHLVLDAIAQFPEATTPAEACRLAGIDPDALELDRAA